VRPGVILVPYVAGMLHPETVRLLGEHAPGHGLAEISPADMSAYWRLLAAAWREPGELVVVEHDIGIGPEVVPGFAACPEPYCGHPYNAAGSLLACLGCTRFSAALKAAEPDLLEVVGEVTGDGLPARDWRRLDVRISDELKRRGCAVHVHEPAVEHFHEYGKP
jgi:hypothetical protein